MWPNPRIPFQTSSESARFEPLRGKPLIVNPVVNIEYWPFDRAMPRGILPPPHGAQVAPPDLPNYSWVEYGMRCGMPRLFDLPGTPTRLPTRRRRSGCAIVASPRLPRSRGTPWVGDVHWPWRAICG